MDEYLVPSGYGEDEFIEKKSRFIGRVWPVETEEEALEKIQAMKKQHYDATHNCWAYIIKDGAVRFSDDGEPGGTAGKPMINVLRKNELHNVTAIVTRYFGGIKLGAGGLVRAYSKSVMEAIGEAEIVEIEEYEVYEINFEYCDIKLVDGDKTITVKKGETFYIKGVHTHYLVNENQAIAKVLWITTPPLF